MLHEAHPTVSWPTLFVVVAYYVFVVRIRVLCKESLDQVSRFFFFEFENNVNLIDVAHIESDWVPCLGFDILVRHEFVWHVDWTGQLRCPLQAENEEI